MARVKFVLLFQGRSGSTWVIEAITSHPNILAFGEALIELKALGAPIQSAWVREFLEQPTPSAISAVGFKTKLVDVIDQVAFARILEEEGCRIIHLVRRNTVKQAISWIRADVLHMKTARHNIWSRWDELGRLKLDPQLFAHRLDCLEEGQMHLADFVDRLRCAKLHLTYETLLEDTEGEFARLQGFLGVPSNSLRWSVLKNTDDNLRRSVQNLPELRAVVRSPAHCRMFDEISADLPFGYRAVSTL